MTAPVPKLYALRNINSDSKKNIIEYVEEMALWLKFYTGNLKKRTIRVLVCLKVCLLIDTGQTFTVQYKFCLAPPLRHRHPSPDPIPVCLPEEVTARLIHCEVILYIQFMGPLLCIEEFAAKM